MKKKIKIIAGSAACILLVAGTVVSASGLSNNKVTVVPVTDITASGGMNDMELQGTITSNAALQVDYSDDKPVKEIFVKEGDHVSVGDSLLSYDVTLSNIELEKKKLDKQELELQIKRARKEISDLKNPKPTAPPPSEPEIPSGPEEENPEGENEEPAERTPEVPAAPEPVVPEVDNTKLIRQKENEIKGYELDLKDIDLEISKMSKEVNEHTLKSTITGIVKTVGDPSKPSADGTPLLLITGSEGLYVKGEIKENRLDKITKGTILEGYSFENNIAFTAEVQEVSPFPLKNTDTYSSGASSTYSFTAYIPESEGLKNNDWVSLSVTDSSDEESELVALEKPFVRNENGKYYVMKDNGKGRLKKQPVTVTRVVDGYAYEISKGLSPDDKIAFPYGKNVKDGAKTHTGTLEDLY